jgi:hypothetical protein
MFGFMEKSNIRTNRTTLPKIRDIRLPKRLALLCLLGWFFIHPICVNAQDIEQVVKAKPVKVSGGANATTSFYNVTGEEDTRDPYFWQVMANINFNFWGVVDMPFSAYFAKKNVRYQQPSFHQFGMSPKYKAVTLHLGYRNMTFSNYSLAGLTFLGAGIEYEPKDFWLKASAMYGRFFKAVPYAADSALNTFEDPSYERWGGGLKVTGQKKNQEVSIIVFKAADKPNSIPDPPSGSTVAPAENFITAIATKNRITDALTLRFEYTLSAYTSDIRNPDKEFDQYTYMNNLGSLFSPKYSSSMGKAFEAQVDYQIDFISLGLSYKRIDPNFKSLGSTFIENDLEDILVNVSKPLFKKKLNLSGSLGQQRNNLDETKENEDKRIIGTANASLSISKSLNLSVNYSNFTSSTQPSLINFTDSVKFFQINKNASFTISYNKGNENIRHGVSLMMAIQEGRSLNRSATQEIETGNDMVNGNLAYNVSFTPIATSVTASFQMSQFKTDLNKTTTLGPNFTVTRAFLKNKLNTSLSYSYQVSKLPGNMQNNNQIFRLNCDFKIDKFQSVNLYASNLLRTRTATDSSRSKIREVQAGITYQFTF